MPRGCEGTLRGSQGAIEFHFRKMKLFCFPFRYGAALVVVFETIVQDPTRLVTGMASSWLRLAGHGDVPWLSFVGALAVASAMWGLGACLLFRCVTVEDARAMPRAQQRVSTTGATTSSGATRKAAFKLILQHSRTRFAVDYTEITLET